MTIAGAPVAPRVRVVEPDRPKKDTIVLHIEHDEDDMNNDLAVHTFRVQYKTDEGTWETAPSEEYQLNGKSIKQSGTHYQENANINDRHWHFTDT